MPCCLLSANFVFVFCRQSLSKEEKATCASTLDSQGASKRYCSICKQPLRGTAQLASVSKRGPASVSMQGLLITPQDTFTGPTYLSPSPHLQFRAGSSWPWLGEPQAALCTFWANSRAYTAQFASVSKRGPASVSRQGLLMTPPDAFTGPICRSNEGKCMKSPYSGGPRKTYIVYLVQCPTHKRPVCHCLFAQARWELRHRWNSCLCHPCPWCTSLWQIHEYLVWSPVVGRFFRHRHGDRRLGGRPCRCRCYRVHHHQLHSPGHLLLLPLPRAPLEANRCPLPLHSRLRHHAGSTGRHLRRHVLNALVSGSSTD